jgi:hypothetical protein
MIYDLKKQQNKKLKMKVSNKLTTENKQLTKTKLSMKKYY